MMLRTMAPIVGALLLAMGAGACQVGEAPEDSASFDAALCSNSDGTNYMLASLAAATAKELRRWQPGVDFREVYKCNYVYTGPSCTTVIELTPAGKSRCADGQCKNVQAILDFQKREANLSVKFPGGVVFRNDTFVNRLVANFRRQITCNSQPDNHNDSNCPSEAHDLAFSYSAPGGCETDYWFHAYKAGTQQPLTYPRQLKNQLLMFGYLDGWQSNPYLAFDVQGDDVKIDPGPGTIADDPSLTGACPVLGIDGRFSFWDISGQCCMYQGRAGRFWRSAFSYYFYLCR
ncbi:MAG TPA: hypothetical protein VFQ61_12650 [Polyangiaceae bacterium]|nr:hypothetical protein [Polyangiaceae bacterium]